LRMRWSIPHTGAQQNPRSEPRRRSATMGQAAGGRRQSPATRVTSPSRRRPGTDTDTDTDTVPRHTPNATGWDGGEKRNKRDARRDRTTMRKAVDGESTMIGGDKTRARCGNDLGSCRRNKSQPAGEAKLKVWAGSDSAEQTNKKGQKGGARRGEKGSGYGCGCGRGRGRGHRVTGHGGVATPHQRPKTKTSDPGPRTDRAKDTRPDPMQTEIEQPLVLVT
jgi:hypothetical protein